MVNNIKELTKIKKLKTNKNFLNNNYRFGYLSQILSERKYKLGKLIGGNLTMCQGLASKKIYRKSWRSKKSICKLGVFEILGVHLIDTISYHFKIKKIFKKLLNLSKVGNSFDTSHFRIILEKNTQINCFVSYFAPFVSTQNLIFENGILEMSQKILKLGSKRYF